MFKSLPLIPRTGTCDPYLLSHLPDLWWPSRASLHGDYYPDSLLMSLGHQLIGEDSEAWPWSLEAGKLWVNDS